MKNLEKNMFTQIVYDIYTGDEEEFSAVCQDIFEQFTDEISTYEILTQGVHNSFANWLKGLPSDVNVLYYLDDIKELFENWGIEVDYLNQDIFEVYYNGITSTIIENLY